METAPLRRLGVHDLKTERRLPAGQVMALRPRLEGLAAAFLERLAAFGLGSASLAIDTVAPPRIAPGLYDPGMYWISAPLAAAPPGFDINVRLDRNLVFALCEAAYGGAGITAPFTEERPFSEIELGLARLFIGELAKAFADFASRANAALPEMTAPMAGKADKRLPFLAAAEAAFICEAFGYSGEMILAFPQAWLDLLAPAAPQKQLEAVNPPPAAAGNQRVGEAAIRLEIVLAELALSLGDIAGFRAGQMLPLPASLNSLVAVNCAGAFLCNAGIARSETNYAVSVVFPPAGRRQLSMGDT